jgi:hypothetical protein
MAKREKVGNIEFLKVDLKDPDDLKLLRSLKETTPIRFQYNGQMAMGVVVPQTRPRPVSYVKNIDRYNMDSVSENNIHEIIETCRKLFVWEGMVGTVIDLLTELTVTPIKISNLKSRKAREVVKYLMRYINIGNNNVTRGLDAMNKMVCLEYYLAGNVFLYETWRAVNINGKDKVKIPVSIVPIDPTMIDIPRASVIFGNKVFELKLSKLSTNDTVLLRQMPPQIRRAIKSGRSKIRIRNDKIYHIKRKGTSYAGWGIPYLTRAIPPIASKIKLRELDDSTTEGLINTITIFKVGDKDNEATWSPARLRALASMLANPSPTLTLVWSYDIDVLYVGPKGEILNFTDKYRQVNYDIITALGLPLSLLTGQGERAGDLWASIMLLLERLNEYKLEFKIYLENLLDKIFAVNNLPAEEPVVRFAKQTLKSDDIKNVILTLYDRGLLSRETALEEVGYDVESMVRQLKEEQRLGYDELFVPPELPFTKRTKRTDNTRTKTTVNDKVTKVIKKAISELQSNFVSYAKRLQRKINGEIELKKIREDLNSKFKSALELLSAHGLINDVDSVMSSIESTINLTVQNMINRVKNGEEIKKSEILDLIDACINLIEY